MHKHHLSLWTCICLPQFPDTCDFYTCCAGWTCTGHTCDVPACVHAGREVREQMFEQVTDLLHDLDDGLLPITVFAPNLPIAAHRKRDA